MMDIKEHQHAWSIRFLKKKKGLETNVKEQLAEELH